MLVEALGIPDMTAGVLDLAAGIDVDVGKRWQWIRCCWDPLRLVSACGEYLVDVSYVDKLQGVLVASRRSTWLNNDTFTKARM
jgi:hypothetical protein